MLELKNAADGELSGRPRSTGIRSQRTERVESILSEKREKAAWGKKSSRDLPYHRGAPVFL